MRLVVVDDEDVRGIVGSVPDGDAVGLRDVVMTPSVSAGFNGEPAHATLHETSAVLRHRSCANRKRRTDRVGTGAELRQRRGRRAEPAVRSRLARAPTGLRSDKAGAGAGRHSRPLHDTALVDQLLQHTAEALLGDLQNVEQVGDAQARVAVDEVQDAMMGAAEAEVAPGSASGSRVKSR